MMDDSEPLRLPELKNGYYPTTLWTVILSAKEGDSSSEEAMKILLEKYRQPIQTQIQKHFRDDPENLTNDFVAYVFAGQLIRKADRDQGRFRHFLGAALRNFINDELRRRYALKRGHGQAPVPIDSEDLENWQDGSIDPKAFGRSLDLEIAKKTVARAFAKVREPYEASGRLVEFHYLIGDRASEPLATIAKELKTSVEVVKARRHRLSQTLRQAFRREVADLVAEVEVGEEVRYLLELMGSLGTTEQ